MTDQEFIAIWNSASTVNEVAVVARSTKPRVCTKANRLRKAGHQLKKFPWKYIQPVEHRFWLQVNKTEECWVWTGAANKKGYGQISTRRGSRPLLAHRLSFEIHFGAIPDGLMILHHCDNPACVRPDHLFAGTARDNTVDMIAKHRGHWQRNRPSRKTA